MVRVLHFQRWPKRGQVSIERLFAQLRAAMPEDIRCETRVSPYPSAGIMPRLTNLRVARREQGDVNHVTGDIHYLAAGLDVRKTVLTVHDCVSLNRLRGMRREIFRLLWYTLPIRRCRVVTTISDSTKRELLRYVRCDPKKIRVIHNCVGPEFRLTPKAFSDGNPRILQVGTGANKNLLRVAQALRGMRCQLHVIGRLSLEQSRMLSDCHVDFSNTDWATDTQIVEEYVRCDLVIFASTYEGFGLPVVEAQSIGRPVVTSNHLSMPEVAGGAACLVDPFDIADIRRGIERVIKDSQYRARLVREGIQNVARFSPDTIASQYARIYRQIASIKHH